MYLDDILKYKRVCIASNAVNEGIVDKLLNDLMSYVNNKMTVINDIDEFDDSILEKKDVVCFRPINLYLKRGMKLPYGDNFAIFKSHLYTYLNNNGISHNLPTNILYNCDLVISILNGKITVVKDRYNYFLSRNTDKLYNEILLDNRYYKIKKILERNERFTENR